MPYLSFLCFSFCPSNDPHFKLPPHFCSCCFSYADTPQLLWSVFSWAHYLLPFFFSQSWFSSKHYNCLYISQAFNSLVSYFWYPIGTQDDAVTSQYLLRNKSVCNFKLLKMRCLPCFIGSHKLHLIQKKHRGNIMQIFLSYLAIFK